MNSTAKAPAITVAYVIKGHMKLPPNDAAVRLIQHTVEAAQ